MIRRNSYAGLRIAFVGSCQVAGLAAAARAFLPGVDTSVWHIGVHPKDSEEEIREKLEGFDLIVTMVPDSGPHELLRISRLRTEGLPAILLPTFSFTGFHPDIVYIPGADGTLVHGLGSDYHSSIAAAAFVVGLPVKRAVGLFNQYIFARLGFFEVFPASRAALIDLFQSEGYDIAPLFEHWLRVAGPFMYTINHPHIVVMTTLCKLVLERAGYVSETTPLPTGVEDYLREHFVWPVYPELARRFGVPGSLTFLRYKYALFPWQRREISLAEYVAGCYEIYEGVDRSVLASGVIGQVAERLREVVRN